MIATDENLNRAVIEDMPAPVPLRMPVRMPAPAQYEPVTPELEEESILIPEEEEEEKAEEENETVGEKKTIKFTM